MYYDFDIAVNKGHNFGTSKITLYTFLFTTISEVGFVNNRCITCSLKKPYHSVKVTKRFPFVNILMMHFSLFFVRQLRNFFIYLSYFEDLKETDSSCVNRRKSLTFKDWYFVRIVSTVITETSNDAAVKYLNSFEKTFSHSDLAFSKKLRINVCHKSTKLEEEKPIKKNY